MFFGSVLHFFSLVFISYFDCLLSLPLSNSRAIFLSFLLYVRLFNCFPLIVFPFTALLFLLCVFFLFYEKLYTFCVLFSLNYFHAKKK